MSDSESLVPGPFHDLPTRPLVYPTIELSNNNQFTNILLIDSCVNDYQTFVDSVNSSTLPIVYSIGSSKTDLLNLLQTNFTNISRIGIVFTSYSDSNLENTKLFLDFKPFFVNEDLDVDSDSENLKFITNVIKEFNVKNIDYLACNTLDNANWINYYKVLTENTGVIVGASNDKTGNIKYGGDWVMESTSQDIELVYFTKSIEYYSYLLDVDPASGTSIITGLFNPSQIVFDNLGNMYVADTRNHRIGKYIKSTGQYNANFISGNGIYFPSGVACDNLGNVYVADSSKNRIGKYTNDTGYNPDFITGVSNPFGVACDSLGNIYVAETNASRIGKYINGTYTNDFITGLSFPCGVACDSLGNIYVADTYANRIGKHTNGTYTNDFINGLSYPHGVACDDEGNLYVARNNSTNIIRYTNVKTVQTISGNYPESKSITLPINIPVQITATASSGLPVTYSSSNSDIVTVDSATRLITVVGPGTAYIYIDQVGNETYAAAPRVTISVNFTVQTITTSTSSISTTYSPTTQTVNLTATTDSNLPLTYSSSNPSVVTVDSGSGVVTILNAGTANIYIDQAGNDTFLPAGRVSVPVIVEKASQTLVPLQNFAKFGNNSTVSVYSNLVSIGPGAVTYSSSLTNVATVDSTGVATIIGAGTTIITYYKAGTDNYEAVEATSELTVEKGDQPVIADLAVSKNFGDTHTLADPGFLGTGAISYTILSGDQFATVNSLGEVDCFGVGDVSIRINKEEGTNYKEGSAIVNITVNATVPSAPTITITTNGNNSINLFFPVVINNGGSPITDRWISLDNGTTFSNSYNIAPGANIVSLPPGTYNIRMKVSNSVGDSPLTANYNITIDKKIQTIIASTIATRIYSPTTQTVNLRATTDSGLPLTYSSSNPSVATVDSKGVVTILTAGTANIYIDQPGDETYLVADRVTRQVIVAKANQPLFSISPLTKNFGDIFTLADPGFLGTGAISYTASGMNGGSVNESGQVTLNGVGWLSIDIFKAADANYKDGMMSIPVTVNAIAPSSPTIISVTKNGNNSMTMNFLSPSSNGGSEITSYSYSVNDAAFVQMSMSSISGISPYSYVITGLTSYNKLQLKATNIVGDSPVHTANEILLSNICFPASTPITTNQGNIPIEKLNPEIHTIRNKPIIGITQTITQDKYLVSFEKDAIGPNIPNQKTIISKNHCIFYKGKLIPAKEFIGLFENVKKVKYNGEILYNVIMEEHDKMLVNNLICETLHPENVVTKVYKALKNLNPERQQEMIKECNEHITKNKLYTCNAKK